MSCYAVVGMGSIAKRHLANLRHLHPDANIYAVSSSGSNVDLPQHTDAVVSLDVMISYQPDYVIVASPAPFHTDITNKLLSRKIPVLIEKPLAHNVDSCMALQDARKTETEVDVAVGYCLRFLPSALAVKKFLDERLLGKIYNVEANVGQYLPTWRTDKNYLNSVSAKKELGGGALLELSHELDYLVWLLGDLKLQHSWLRTSNELGLEVEDIADLILTNKDDTYIAVHLDFIQKSTQRKCEFVGEKGRLVWDLILNSVTLHGAHGIESLYCMPEYNKNGMYIGMLTAFENIKKDGFANLATIDSAVKVIQLIDEAKRSNKWRKIS